METIQLLGSTLGLAFASGINLYASVLFVGLGIRFGVLQLPSELSSLSVLSHQNVLIVAGILYLVEFIADKVPWVDSLWDSFHTVIRPLGAALIGISAISNMDPAAKVLMFLLCGGVALSSHSTKAGARLAINHSPEPLSNIGMSLFEDLLAAGSSWLALMHPMLMFGIVLAFLSVFALLAPKFYRLFRVETQAFLSLLRRFFSFTIDSENPPLFDTPPEKFKRALSNLASAKGGDFCVRCVTGKGADAGKNYMGYLCLSGQELFFLTRKHWRIRQYDLEIARIDQLEYEKGLLLDRLIFQKDKKRFYLYLFKHRPNQGERIKTRLDLLRQGIRPSAESRSPIVI